VAQIFESLRPTVTSGKVWAVPLEDGDVAALPELLVDLGDAAANDGLALDEHGRLYVAANGFGQIWRVDPVSAETVLIAEDMPGAASIAFGQGAFDPEAIYVTSTRTGKVWEVEVGARGAPLHHGRSAATGARLPGVRHPAGDAFDAGEESIADPLECPTHDGLVQDSDPHGENRQSNGPRQGR
jgi:hypothetical protein